MARNIKILDRQAVPAGVIVIKQGTTGQHAYVIESGKVEVFIQDAAGNITVVAELGPEAMFGEMSSIAGGGLRSASVRTIENSVLVTISADDMQESIRTSPGLHTRLMRMVTDRMWDNNTKLWGNKQEQPEEARQAALTLKDIALQISKAKLADLGKDREKAPILSMIKSTLEKFQKR